MIELVDALVQAKLAVLVAAIVHLTGDESLLERWDADAPPAASGRPCPRPTCASRAASP